MKFLVPNYTCLQNPWLGASRPPDPRSLCLLSSTEFVEPPLNKIPGYATDVRLCRSVSSYLRFNGSYCLYLQGHNCLTIILPRLLVLQEEDIIVTALPWTTCARTQRSTSTIFSGSTEIISNIASGKLQLGQGGGGRHESVYHLAMSCLCVAEWLYEEYDVKSVAPKFK